MKRAVPWVRGSLFFSLCLMSLLFLSTSNCYGDETGVLGKLGTMKTSGVSFLKNTFLPVVQGVAIGAAAVFSAFQLNQAKLYCYYGFISAFIPNVLLYLTGL